MIAVLLLAFGCPDSIESIEPFITNVMGGRKPSPNQLKKIKERYQKIDGRSPLLDITRRQAEALERTLNIIPNSQFRVFVGMRYWHPFIKDTLKEIVNSGAERIVAIVMAPHYSKISTGHYIKAVNDARTEINTNIDISFINNWHTHPLFLEAVAEKIKKGFSNFPPLISSPLWGEAGLPLLRSIAMGSGEGVQVIFSAHSLPAEDAPYVKQLNETIDGVIKLTGTLSWHLGFQSKGMSHGEWLEPTVDSILERLSKEGKKYVLIVPVGFVSDNIETLYDIDIVYRGMVESLGMIFHRTDSLNDSSKFIESLSGIVREHLHTFV